MSQSILEKIGKAIFDKFQELHPDGSKMKKWEELDNKGKNFAFELAKAALNALDEYMKPS